MMLAADVSWKVKASGLQKVHTRAQLCLIWLSRNRLFRHERCCTRIWCCERRVVCLVRCVCQEGDRKAFLSVRHTRPANQRHYYLRQYLRQRIRPTVSRWSVIFSLLFYCRLCRRRCRAGCIINPIFARPEATVSSIKSIFLFVPTFERTYFPSHLIWEILLGQKLLQNFACKFKISREMRWSWLYFFSATRNMF